VLTLGKGQKVTVNGYHFVPTATGVVCCRLP
jgi:hypothetical protein